ncbi:hypothetical protein AB1Y20_016084 [Prymnesium parvum]|uniref:Uncharacterized protein n=1 Tax=Prymnesium parvum TaxID=97485 RepID=A0AB34K394_PRYPA
MATRHLHTPRAESRDSRPGSTQRSREASPHHALDEGMDIVPPPGGGDHHHLTEEDILAGVPDADTQGMEEDEPEPQPKELPPPPPIFDNAELAAAAATPLNMEKRDNKAPPPSPSYSATSSTAEIHQVHTDGGYLQIYYAANTHRDDRIRLDEGMIIQAINTAIAQHEDESLFPMIEQGSIIVKDVWVCAQVTMTSYAQCVNFAKAYEDLPVYDGDRVAVLSVEARQIDMRALFGLNTASASSTPIRASPKPQEDVLAQQGGWLEVRLTMEQAQAGITKEQVIKAVEAIGLDTYRRREVAGKVKDEGGEKLTLSDSFKTQRFNMIIKPKEGTMADFKWERWPTIPLSLETVYQGEQGKLNTELRYTVGGRGLVDYDQEKDKHGRYPWKICNGLDGCKGPLAACWPRCRKRERDHFHRQHLQQLAKEARKKHNISQAKAMREAKAQRAETAHKGVGRRVVVEAVITLSISACTLSCLSVLLLSDCCVCAMEGEQGT